MTKEIFKFVNKNVEFSFNENFNGNTDDAVSTGYSLNWNNLPKVKYVNIPQYRAARLEVKPGEHSDKVEKALGLMQSNGTTFDSICKVFRYTKYYTYDHMD